MSFVGDEVTEPLDAVTAEDWLGFGGIAPPALPIISAEQQFAEKLHAYTVLRTKDLVDMVLLIKQEKLDKEKVAACRARHV
jgi:hypothetical protein